MAPAFGSGTFEFGAWATPFSDATVEILEVAYAPRRGGRAPQDADLVARVHDRDADRVYRLVFPSIAAMRLVDEGGLLELWRMTATLGGRPGRTTFRVRNHAWTDESVLAFVGTDGWSFVIATEDMCLEVVTATAPTITAA